MAKICYVPKAFNARTRAVIEQANAIIDEYAAQGFDLTLRQLYYQFVARDMIPNRLQEYKRLGAILSEARLAGYVDWEAISDRTRSLRARSHWSTPDSIIDSAVASYHLDFWKDQGYRPEVWIEKDALVGVIEGVCADWDVPYFSCRGYSSQSEMWRAAMRLREAVVTEGKIPIIFHLGDHDPSGLDMTRDIVDRLETFIGPVVMLERLALSMEQVQTYNPPPNPAKITDPRAAQYISLHGDDSWELDALEPRVLADLITSAVERIVDQDVWDVTDERKKADRRLLRQLAKKAREERSGDE